MQLNPINAVGFKGVRTDNYTYGEQKTSDMINDAINSYAATIREKQQDVHNTTLIAALLTAGASIMAGRKFTDGICKLTINAGEVASKTFVKLGGEANNLFRKQKQINVQNILNTITKKANSIRDISSKPSEKFVNGVKDFFTSITSQEKGENIANVITEKFKINSLAGLIKSGVAAGFAWGAADKVGDFAENISDMKDINKAGAHLENAIASEEYLYETDDDSVKEKHNEIKKELKSAIIKMAIDAA